MALSPSSRSSIFGNFCFKTCFDFLGVFTSARHEIAQESAYEASLVDETVVRPPNRRPRMRNNRRVLCSLFSAPRKTNHDYIVWVFFTLRAVLQLNRCDITPTTDIIRDTFHLRGCFTAKAALHVIQKMWVFTLRDVFTTKSAWHHPNNT